MSEAKPLDSAPKKNGTLERLLQKAELDLNRNRKTQEQLDLAFFGLRTNFKNLKDEKIIKIDSYKNILYNIDNVLKLLKDYKKEEFGLVKKIKSIKTEIVNYSKPPEPVEPKKVKPKIYEFARYRKET